MVRHSTKYGNFGDPMQKNFRYGSIKEAGKLHQYQLQKLYFGHNVKKTQNAFPKDGLLETERNRRASLAALDGLHSIHSTRSIQQDIRHGLAAVRVQDETQSTAHDLPAAEPSHYHSTQLNRDILGVTQKNQLRTQREKQVMEFNEQQISHTLQTAQEQHSRCGADAQDQDGLRQQLLERIKGSSGPR